MLQLTFSDERAPQLMVYFPKGSPKRVPYLIEAFVRNELVLRRRLYR